MAVKERLKYKTYSSSDFPITVLHGTMPKAKYNDTSDKIYQRDFWKIFYISAGEGSLEINSKSYEFGPGFVCLIHPDDLTTFRLKSDKIDIYKIIFFKRAINSWLEELESDYGFFSIFHETPDQPKNPMRDQLYLLNSNREIQQLIKKMRKEYQSQNPNSLMRLRLNLVELLILLTRLSSNNYSKKRRSNVISYIQNYLEKNYSIQFDYEKIAGQLGISRAYLCRLYRQKTDESIGETLFAIRMKNARKLVKETDKAISEICFECGFNDLSYFYRAFKNETSLPPAKFRNTDNR